MSLPFEHSKAYRTRRFFNWFPLGLTYALLYMGRYNLTVAKNSLGDLMTKEDFGFIFGVGALTYGISFLVNGPLVDRLGGKKGILIAAAGSCLMNVLMGLYLLSALSASSTPGNLRLVFTLLYAANMYFQSYAAVSIVKVNAHWFHVNERGGFSGIFGTMIASGIFLAFTVNGWMLNPELLSFLPSPRQWIVFFFPASLLAAMFVVELFLLKDRPGLAGFEDFDTGDASSGEDEKPIPVLQLYKRILTNPIIITIALIEFCTGVIRNGIMHWLPFYLKEVWALPSNHPLVYGEWSMPWLIGLAFLVAVISFVLAKRSTTGSVKVWLYVFGALAFLAPFLQGGWGGILFVAGVIGGNVAGWVSDLVFQSRRAPAAGGLYGLLVICLVVMIFALKPATTEVDWARSTFDVEAGDNLEAFVDTLEEAGFTASADAEAGELSVELPGVDALEQVRDMAARANIELSSTGLLPGDQVLSIAGVDELDDWEAVARAVQCIPATCQEGSRWDSEACLCSSRVEEVDEDLEVSTGIIPTTVLRDDETIELSLADPKPSMQAGDTRKLRSGPRIPISPYFLGFIGFVISLCVIGSHGLLSGTATMDFGGRKAAATAVGIIDGFVYLGTFVEAIALGYLTTKSWTYWPIFLLPFGVIGFYLATRIWHAKPGSGGGH